MRGAQRDAMRAARGDSKAGSMVVVRLRGLPFSATERPPPPRTKWTRRVPHPVLIGHAASLTPYYSDRSGTWRAFWRASRFAAAGCTPPPPLSY